MGSEDVVGLSLWKVMQAAPAYMFVQSQAQMQHCIVYSHTAVQLHQPVQL